MKKIASALLIAFWAAVGYFPFALHAYWRQYHAAIGCPEDGDCYVPGAEHLLELELLFGAAAALFWPLACFKMYATARSVFARG